MNVRLITATTLFFLICTGTGCAGLPVRGSVSQVKESTAPQKESKPATRTCRFQNLVFELPADFETERETESRMVFTQPDGSRLLLTCIRLNRMNTYSLQELSARSMDHLCSTNVSWKHGEGKKLVLPSVGQSALVFMIDGKDMDGDPVDGKAVYVYDDGFLYTLMYTEKKAFSHMEEFDALLDSLFFRTG